MFSRGQGIAWLCVFVFEAETAMAAENILLETAPDTRAKPLHNASDQDCMMKAGPSGGHFMLTYATSNQRC